MNEKSKYIPFEDIVPGKVYKLWYIYGEDRFKVGIIVQHHYSDHFKYYDLTTKKVSILNKNLWHIEEI